MQEGGGLKFSKQYAWSAKSQNGFFLRFLHKKKLFENFNPMGPRVENFEKLMSDSWSATPKTPGDEFFRNSKIFEKRWRRTTVIPCLFTKIFEGSIVRWKNGKKSISEGLLPQRKRSLFYFSLIRLYLYRLSPFIFINLLLIYLVLHWLTLDAMCSLRVDILELGKL